MNTSRATRWLVSSLAALACLAVLSLPLSACPNCAEGLASASGSGETDDDPLRESRAYNQSIYLMVGMPYLLLTAFGLVIFLAVVRSGRATRAAEAAKQPQTPDALPPASAA